MQKNSALSAPRTSYNTSSSLYGGDMDIDADLDSYWTSGAGKKGSKKKKQGTKNKFVEEPAAAASSSSSSQQRAAKKSKKSHTPAGMVNLGYGLLHESSSLVFSTEKVKGVCQTLEKDFLRLTSAADPANVRPPNVLAQALTMVKRKWIETQDYEYCCNQLKSIRQDCTVQHLKNTFTVEVYETHARIALESNDFQEFGQCQTQLQLLYKEGHSSGFERECEFAGYKILYACLMTGPSDPGLVSFMNGLDDAHREHEAVKHASFVRTALLTTNFHLFFQSWSDAPNMSAYIMDPLADSMRERSARILIAAYRPKISLAHLTRTLAFDREEENANDAAAASSSAASSPPPPNAPPSIAAQRACKAYLDERFDGLFVWLTEPDSTGAKKTYVDCKLTHDVLTPSNAQHRLPINSARARHTISSSSASPSLAPIAAPHDVSSWIKRGASGIVTLAGGLNGKASPSLSPSPPPPPPIDDAISRKRKNSQPLSAMSYDELKTACDETEAELLAPNVKEKYDDFSIQLMISRLKALKHQLKKTKPGKK